MFYHDFQEIEYLFIYLFILSAFNKTSAFKYKNEFNVTITNKKCHENK